MVYHDRSSFPEFEKLFWPNSHDSGVSIIIKGELRQKLHPCLCVRYLLILWRKDSAPTPLSAGGSNFQSQILERVDQEKMSAWGDLKSSLPSIFTWGLTMFLVKKILLKIKYGFFRAQFQMLILACFSQKKTMFSFVTFSFC